MNIYDRIHQTGIVPVVKIDDPSKTVPLAHALMEGGIPCAEITFRTDCAAEAIGLIAAALPDMLVGAGTVLTTQQADAAIDAGAKFVVSPGLNPRVVEHCQRRGVVIIPGCATPSDVERALELNLSTVKFFPAEQAGGVEYIKALSAPYSMVRFMPTGGINVANVGNYLSLKNVIACGGSWMVGANLIDAENFQKITQLSREAAGMVASSRG